MLRIYPVSIEIVRAVRPLADLIARHDRDHARQLRRAALEARAGLEVAEAMGYIPPIDPALAAALNRVIGTLVRNVG